ncbi:UDP-N-acetyl-D-glucosamine dehydrogenase [Kineosporia sp. NBRC 101677]|uniref:nucleotide sugar dehydrogenase n=1 Tax=Kineosporia sp. NBRC 101677 TaxID=3032197 RepID=UPI0024A50415|nr:nucleotide sugar dehydrogenase [Kineosporia sp. NBRC 101677]GLY14824.1 UDP-N-acetyl-D-glucosamine dehydrogenase [Kineosporia sp. NBRC 101677]
MSHDTPTGPDAPDLVVVGLGYVGLPLAQEACRSGLQVAGLDLDVAVVEHLNSGRSHVDDLSDADIAAMRQAGFSAHTDASVVAGARTVVICVPTPLSEDGGPDLRMVLAATASVAAFVQRDTLVVLESTTYPGTTDELLRPMLEEGGLKVGQDLFLAYSPERIDPGNDRWGFRNTPKVIGGTTGACTDRAAAFYRKIVDEVITARGTREAEMSKLLENTYRHVNIALVNEMTRFCHELGIDLWDVIRCAATKPFGFQAFYPGPGVGGHCIPIDPNYLSYRVRAALGYPFRFVELAQEINHAMPGYVVQRVQDRLNDVAKPLRGSRVLLLGVTYKADISDQRESPAVPIAIRLQSAGADIAFHDPFVTDWALSGDPVRSPGEPVGHDLAPEGEPGNPATSHGMLRCVPDLAGALGRADIVVLLQRHSSYDLDEIARLAPLVLDTRGAFDNAADSADSATVERL